MAVDCASEACIERVLAPVVCALSLECLSKARASDLASIRPACCGRDGERVSRDGSEEKWRR